MGLSADERDKFDRILEGVMAALPDDVREELDIIPVIVEDEPSQEILDQIGIEPDSEFPDEPDLCGLHSGIPLTERSVFEVAGLPPSIYLFRGPIIRLSDGRKRALEREIRITLLHELGHHFGFSEEKLHSLGYE